MYQREKFLYKVKARNLLTFIGIYSSFKTCTQRKAASLWRSVPTHPQERLKALYRHQQQTHQKVSQRQAQLGSKLEQQGPMEGQ